MEPGASPFSLPLLWKELAEQANRKRTYLIRVVFGAVILLLTHGWLSSGSEVLGSGLPIFRRLVQLELWAAWLILPAAIAPIIPTAKENRTLDLFWLTGLRPWQTVLQWYGGRMLPVLMVLFAAQPVAALAYVFGGVSTHSLIVYQLLIALTCLAIGAVSLACSALCRTSTQAMIAAYALAWIPWFLCYCWLSVVLVFDRWGANGPAPWAGFVWGNFDLIGIAYVQVLHVIIYLWASTRWLVSRAPSKSRRRIVTWLRGLDSYLQRWSGTIWGRELFPETQDLPDDRPVAWRESNKRGILKMHHLTRLLLVVEILAVIAVILQLYAGPGADDYTATGFSDNYFFSSRDLGRTLENSLSGALWIVAMTSLMVIGVNSFGLERDSQTLDMLVVTPMDGFDIVGEKYDSIQRLAIIWAIPLATYFSVSVTWAYDSLVAKLLTLGVMLLAIILHLHLAAWLGLWAGLRGRRRSRAVALGMVLLAMASAMPGPFSPLKTFINFGDSSSFVWAIINFLAWLPIYYLLRSYCFRHADWYLRRER